MSSHGKRLSAFAAAGLSAETSEVKLKRSKGHGKIHKAKLKKEKMSKKNKRKTENNVDFENKAGKFRKKLKHVGKDSITEKDEQLGISKEVTGIAYNEAKAVVVCSGNAKVGKNDKSDKKTENLTGKETQRNSSFRRDRDKDRNCKSSIHSPETAERNASRKRKRQRSSEKRKKNELFRNSGDDIDKKSKHSRLDDSLMVHKDEAGNEKIDLSCEITEMVVLDDSDADETPVIYISDSSYDGDYKKENADTASPDKFEKSNRGWQRKTRTEGTSVRLSTSSSTSADIDLRPFAVETESGALVLLPHPSECIFKGKAIITLLVGKVAIQGYCLLPKAPVTVYSPECNSLLTIRTIQSENSIRDAVAKVTELHNLSDTQKSHMKTSMQKLKSFVLFHVAKHRSVSCDNITKLDPFTKLFEVKEDRSEVNRALVPLGAALSTDSSMPCLDIGEQLLSVLQLWSGEGNREMPTSVLVCGGKDCGKSTTNRLLMNSALNRQEVSKIPLYYLECDVGQTEFTPPGCVSLVKVTDPVLGPPFCNQRKPLYSCSFGGLSPKADPDRYLDCVKQCVERYRLLNGPGRLVVNTMGWMTGLGFQLLVDIIRLVQPQVIVQLTSPQRYQNIQRLTPEIISSTSWSDLAKGESLEIWDQADYQPTVIHIDQPVTPGYQTRFRASDHRDLSLLSHLCADLEPGMTLASKLPYCICWQDVAVHVCEAEVPWSQVMYSLNASLVALCRADIAKAVQHVDDGPWFFDTLPMCEWFGYGIVRGIDPDKKLLYVLTALPLKELEKVNTLVKGSVTLPDRLLLSQKCKDLAYVDDSKKSHGASSVKPRRHMPRKNLGPTQNN